MNYKLGAFILSLLGITAVVVFGVINVELSGVWETYVKAIFLLTYFLFILIIINFLIISDKKSKNTKPTRRYRRSRRKKK